MKTINVGNVASETQFYTVEEIRNLDVVLKNEDGETITVGKDYISLLNSASEFDKEEEFTRTELIEKFLLCINVAVTANFFKQVKEVDVVKEIEEAYQNSTPKEFTTKLKKSVKKALNGEERTMILKHFGTKDEFGRVKVWDLEVVKDVSKDYDNRQKVLDPRTLTWFICRGIKYKIKK